MAAFLERLARGPREKLRVFVHSSPFHALFHVPIAGAFLTLLLLPYIITHRQSLAQAAKEGIAAQLVVPGLFSLGSLFRYFVWLFELDTVSELLGYVLALYLVVGYAVMAYNTWRVRRGKSCAYKWFEQPIRACLPLIFS